MRPRPHGFLALFIFAVFGMLISGNAMAAEPVKMTEVVIHATKAPGKADKGLAKIQKSLETTFGQYKGFKLVSRQEFKLTKGKPVTLNTPSGGNAKITYKAKVKNRHKVNLAFPKSKANFDVSMPARKMFYQAGFKHGKGILILGFFLKE